MKPTIRHAVAVIPLLLVNGIAVAGQTLFWRSHLPVRYALAAFLLAFVFACALESIAVFLAYHAHLAAISNDSALRLRLASYGMGAVIGILNASHFVTHGRVTALATGMGIVSAASPWLWGIFSRRQSRDKLRDAGLIEAHAVRLGAARWFWHPLMSAWVSRHAAWSGENRPAEAIGAWETANGKREAERKAEQEALAGKPVLAKAATKADAIRAALAEIPDAKPAEITAWLAKRGWPGITSSHVRVIRSQDAAQRRKAIHAVGSSDQLQALPGAVRD